MPECPDMPDTTVPPGVLAALGLAVASGAGAYATGAGLAARTPPVR
ncbi:hypothetical protein P3T26_006871 [Streptomyces sp. MAA16]|nr:hypothetical protein [Streptomyces sp. MAA16]